MLSWLRISYVFFLERSAADVENDAAAAAAVVDRADDDGDDDLRATDAQAPCTAEQAPWWLVHRRPSRRASMVWRWYEGVREV